LKTNETCGVELLNNFTLNYSTECIYEETVFDCDKLQCGCEYEMKIKFDETMINSLCSSSPCDIQLNNSNFTVTKVKTRKNKTISGFPTLLYFCLALDTVKNLQIVNDRLESNKIQVQFDKPSGNYTELILICENNSSKQKKPYSDSASCTDPIPNEIYRIYVETRQNGWETVRSNPIETQFIFSSTLNGSKENNISFSDLFFLIKFIFIRGNPS
jgi:hypothetical protein